MAPREPRRLEGPPDAHAQFEDLVAQYSRHVYAIAYRLTGNEADARDLAQEAFLRVWRALDRVAPGTRLEGWFYRIVSNLHIDLLRRRRGVLVHSLDEPMATPSGDLVRERPDASVDVERAVLEATLDRRVQDALMSLAPDQRMVVVLSDIEGYAYEEIATMLGIPIGTVKSRLHRARRTLRERLASLRAGLHEP
ncbi:MAG: sigma-70 family RNA polymerase sigma factor [Armatimonadota bacterium]|nr:sigma-70 family RNA polymerase sigma factor [Armatimonadota bacterium]